MATLGLDYAGSSPGSAAVKAAGYDFVARYLSRYSSKVITKGEYDDYTNNGVDVVLVFEDYANQALQGYNQGVADAQVALAQANALGWPGDRPIHFAVDFDISDAQKPAAGEYMKGVISVLGLARTGAYGGYWWIKYCVDNGLASFFWQAYAWSGGQIHPSATLFQRLGGVTVNGTSCDVDEALKADFGQNNQQENDMPTLEDLTTARILAFWNGRLDALDGGQDADLKANHVGSEVEKDIYSWLTSAEGQTWKNRISKLPTLEAQVPELQKQIDDLTAQLSAAKSAPTSAPVTPQPPVTPPAKVVVGSVKPTQPPQVQQGFWKTLWHNLFG